jgi:rhodanese-related sulfurtransferase
VELNKKGAAPLSELPELRGFAAPEVLQLQAEGAVVVDTRPAMQFAVAHVPGSLHIALTGQYASWAARILGLDAQLIIAGEDEEHVRESQMRLARVGVENIAGFLEGGIAGWIKSGYELDYIPQISADEFEALKAAEGDHIAVLDVREPGEFETGSIAGARNIPLGQLAARAVELDAGKLWVVHCKGGYRSSIATSLLRRAGLRDIANLTGGYDAWKLLAAGGQMP